MSRKKVRDNTNKGFIFVISGPSGSGKTTLAEKILQQPRLKHRITKSISFTTRPKRPGEKQGQDYFFVSPRQFQQLLRAKKILEHTRYLGYDYGTPREIVEQALGKGLNIILCLDIKGALFIKRAYPDRTIRIFIKPPSLDITKRRILSRSARTKSKEVEQRIKLASQELDYAGQYEYCLVNDNLYDAVGRIKRIITEVEQQPN